MARRSLALLSEGMLSGSLKKTITLASIGWLVITGPVIIPTPSEYVAETRTISGVGSAIGSGSPYYNIYEDTDDAKKRLKKRLLKDQDEMFLIIRMAMKVTNL